MRDAHRRFRIALVTTPDLKTARKLARRALERRLAACANLVPGLESHYWWREKMERSREVLILFKTLQSRLGELEKLVVNEHPYDTPEFVVLSVSGGNERYLRWWDQAARA